MKRTLNRDNHRYQGTHYLPKKSGPEKGASYRTSVPKVEERRLKMEADHLKRLARAYCDENFARDNPILVKMVATLGEDMLAKLKRIYGAKN